MDVRHFIIKKDETLLDVMQREGAFLPAFCGGNGTCGKCRVQFLSDPPVPTETEQTFFTKEELDAGWRLACQVKNRGEEELDAEITVEKRMDESSMAAESAFYGKDGKGASAKNVRKPDISCQGTETSEGGRVVAMDIGTTTLAASLVETATGQVTKTVTSVNHQRTFGADVLSRIKASVEGKGEQLRQCIREDIRSLMDGLGVSPDTPLVISGNTTMEHLLLGYSCRTLGVAPYTPVDLSLHPSGNMTILPGVSAFVGADVVSGVIACSMDENRDINLLVDLGTNGEMVLGNCDKMLASSTAAGPALEGGNISCGMAGIAGAVSSVNIICGRPHIKTIGGGAPAGLCGSGVIEIMYELLKEGFIGADGRPEENFLKNGYEIAPSVTFTIGDVREVQLAKAAIRAGIEVLLREYGTGYEEISHVYLAGGFGQKVNIRKAAGIGLLPEALVPKVRAVGNSSLAGAVLFAGNPSLAGRFQTVAESVKEIVLAQNPLFQEQYLAQMVFPQN